MMGMLDGIHEAQNDYPGMGSGIINNLYGGELLHRSPDLHCFVYAGGCYARSFW
jgi:hypothetical protein